MAGLVALAAGAFASPALCGQPDPYHITTAEKAACTADAIRLCMSAYPDERRLVSCMAANRASLTPSCLAAFDAGLKRRRIVLR